MVSERNNMYRRVVLLTLSALYLAQAAQVEAPGKDLRLSYHSGLDGSDQPYRVYVPSAYDARRPISLVLVLHGTGGTENTFFEDQRMPPGTIKRVAEKYGVLLVSPLGRGTTEYRGTGENDVLSVLADVERRYAVDRDRVYITGQSMGGTGSIYLALHHPDLFAAAAPLAAAYSFPWLAANGKLVPTWWMSGAEDAKFYHQGIQVGVDRMKQLGLDVRLDKLAGEGHPGGLKHLDEVFAWFLTHRRAAHPHDYLFEVDTPLHGRAYWTDVRGIAEPGKMAVVKARAEGAARAHLDLENISSIAFFPDPEVFDLSHRIHVFINGTDVFNGFVPAEKELLITAGGRTWQTALHPRSVPSLIYRRNPVATAPETLDMQGTEARMANWIADAMRSATGADVAVYNRMYYRGLPIRAGTVDIVDLIECSRPFDQYLVTAQLTGRDLISILDANAAEPDRLVQLSGAWYIFDPKLPPGKRILSTSIEPKWRYTVALEGQVVERETMRLAGLFGKLDYKTTNVPFSLALYGYAAKKKIVQASAEGRLCEFGQACGPAIPAGTAEVPFYSDKQNLLYYLDGSGARHEVRDKADWEKRRHDILASMEIVMGPLPRIDHKLPLAIEVLNEGHTEKYTWKRILYTAERGDRVPAFLYIPNGLPRGRRTPGIVSLHGTTYPHYVATDETPAGDTHYARELAGRGYVVIAPDYIYLSPDYRTDPYARGYVSGTMKGIVNHIRAVDVLESLPQVDPQRIGDIGLSLGGHNALFLAVFDPRIRVVVSSAGFNTFRKYYEGNLKGWTSNRYMPRIAMRYQNRPERVPFDFTEVLGALAPRPVFVNAPLSDDNFEVSGVRDCVDAAAPVYKLFGTAGQFVAQYPEGGHGFSDGARQAAYEFLDRWLKPSR
jgi:predicted peptidase